MKLTRREIFILIISTSIIFSVIYFFYFYRPIITETNRLMEQLCQIRKDLIECEKLDVKIEKLKVDLANLRSFSGYFEKNSFEGSEQAKVILSLSDLIQPIGIEKVVRFEGMEDYQTYRVAKVKVCFQIDHSNLHTFLKGIEQLPWRNRIEKMSAVKLNINDLVSHPYDMEVELTIGFYCL